MPTVKYVLNTGEERVIDALQGSNVMQTAVSNLVPGIIGECGGEMSCATCHVYVDQDWMDRIPPIQPSESEMLEVTAAEPDATSRLSCQITCDSATDGIVVRIPEVQ